MSYRKRDLTEAEWNELGFEVIPGEKSATQHITGESLYADDQVRELPEEEEEE